MRKKTHKGLTFSPHPTNLPPLLLVRCAVSSLRAGSKLLRPPFKSTGRTPKGVQQSRSPGRPSALRVDMPTGALTSASTYTQPPLAHMPGREVKPMAGRLAFEARNLIGKTWSVSSQTRTMLLNNIKAIASFMESQGLQSIRHLKTKHVNNYFKHLEARGIGASARSNHATAMRKLASAIGKQNIVPRSNEELGISRADRYAPKSADLEKMTEVSGKLYAKEQWQGLAFDLQKAFGLRLKESLLSNKTTYKDGQPYLQVEGAKGGRARQLAIDTPSKIDALEKVQKHIKESDSKSLIPIEKSLKQAYNTQKNALHRLGATKANKANSHLFRHDSAQSMKKAGKSDKEIAEHLGHGRESITRHYK